MSFLEIPVGNVVVKLDDQDRICGHIKAGKTFEPETLKYFAETLGAVAAARYNAGEEPCTFVDVGCYSGLFSIAAIKLGALAYGVEPMPQNQAQINLNMAINKVKFNVFPGCATDRSGTGRLGYNDRVKLTAGASIERKSGPGYEVMFTRLDDLPIDRVAMIKIDVERHEPAVLRGAQRILAKYRPTLIVEALDEELKKAVLREVPNYELIHTFDTRNLVLQPRA